MDERVRPARPHHRLTEDGRRMREVLSYSRRGNRFTPNQAAAWAAHHERWVIPDEAVDQPGFSLADWFGREAPLIVEIGSGVGEATAQLAATGRRTTCWPSRCGAPAWLTRCGAWPRPVPTTCA